MSWNLRLVHVENEVNLYEVYYDIVTDEPMARTTNPKAIIMYEDEDPECMLAHIERAFTLPILEDEIFKDKVVF